MPDQQAAEQFLELLTGGEPATFQTFDEKGKRRTLNKVLHGDLGKHGDALESLNDRGAGVFVMVNAGDLKGRKAANVQRVRAVFVDLDGSPVAPVLQGPLPPSVVVESSPARFHAYWLTDGLPCAEFRAFQEMLALRFDGDPSVKDLPRVMRLPGYLHQKADPYRTHILKADEQQRYLRGDLLDAFGFDPASSDWRDTVPIKAGQRNDNLFRMARGFVTKGFPIQQVHDRICAINEKRCSPPLSVSEVRELIARAFQYGASGSLSIDYRLMDSPEYKALRPMARALDMAIRRITNGSHESVISLLPRDLAQWGFGNPKTLAKYRDELLDKGFLVLHRPPRYGQQGETKDCGLYRLATPAFMAERATKMDGFYGKTYHPNVVDGNRG